MMIKTVIEMPCKIRIAQGCEGLQVIPLTRLRFYERVWILIPL